MTTDSAATGAGEMETLLRSIIGKAVYTRVQIKCETLEKVADALRAKDAEIEPLTAEIAMWKGLQEGTVAATRAEIERLTKLLTTRFARSSPIEEALLGIAAGKRPLPTREQCGEWGAKLGVPEDFHAILLSKS